MVVVVASSARKYETVIRSSQSIPKPLKRIIKKFVEFNGIHLFILSNVIMKDYNTTAGNSCGLQNIATIYEWKFTFHQNRQPSLLPESKPLLSLEQSLLIGLSYVPLFSYHRCCLILHILRSFLLHKHLCQLKSLLLLRPTQADSD